MGFENRVLSGTIWKIEDQTPQPTQVWVELVGKKECWLILIPFLWILPSLRFAKTNHLITCFSERGLEWKTRKSEQQCFRRKP